VLFARQELTGKACRTSTDVLKFPGAGNQFFAFEFAQMKEKEVRGGQVLSLRYVPSQCLYESAITGIQDGSVLPDAEGIDRAADEGSQMKWLFPEQPIRFPPRLRDRREVRFSLHRELPMAGRPSMGRFCARRARAECVGRDKAGTSDSDRTNKTWEIEWGRIWNRALYLFAVMDECHSNTQLFDLS